MMQSRGLKIFLCHSSGDKVLVRQLFERLRADGFDPWLDEERLLAGQDWNLEITKAVRGTDVVVVCVSTDSVSKAGYVQREIKFALDVADEQPDGAIFLIPAKLDDCIVPERLGRWHWVGLYEEDGYDRLTKSLVKRAQDLGLIARAREIRASSSDSSFVGVGIGDILFPNTHIFFPYDLKEGQTINIDLKSDRELDVFIMENDDYAAWARDEEYEVYNEFLDRDNLHAFFKARETQEYFVVVSNSSDDKAFVHLTIDLA